MKLLIFFYYQQIYRLINFQYGFQQYLIETGKNKLECDSNKWNLTRKSVHSFRNIMSKFNSDVDMIFADIDKYGADGKIDIQQQIGDNKCQITHIVDAEQCFCYAIDMQG